MPHIALKRELKEEVGIEITEFISLMVKAHHYVHKSVELHCFVVTHYKGAIVPQENQQGQWVRVSELNTQIMPEANQEIIEVLQQYLANKITDY